MPAQSTYDCIATQTLGSNTGTITFSSIPQTYTDLVLVAYTRDAGTNSSPFVSPMAMRLNSDSGSNYSNTHMYGNGSSMFSSRETNSNFPTVGQLVTSSAGANIFGMQHIHFLGYSNTSRQKTILTRSAADSNGQGWSWQSVAYWRNTAGINTILLSGGIGGFATGSQFSLYGITAA